MKTNFLFPAGLKKIGWIILVPSLILFVFQALTGYEPALFDAKVFAVFYSGLFEDSKFFEVIQENVFMEFLAILAIIGALFVAFSKEKEEDEFVQKIRLESLVWATYVNYGILLLALVFIFGISFLYVLLFNMFTLLLFFIFRFHWQIYRFKKSFSYAE